MVETWVVFLIDCFIQSGPLQFAPGAFTTTPKSKVLVLPKPPQSNTLNNKYTFTCVLYKRKVGLNMKKIKGDEVPIPSIIYISEASESLKQVKLDKDTPDATQQEFEKLLKKNGVPLENSN